MEINHRVYVPRGGYDWFKFVATATNMQFEAKALVANQVITIADADLSSGVCGSLTSLSCANLSISNGGKRVIGGFSGLTIGQTYHLAIYLGGSFKYSICLTPAPLIPPRTIISTRRGGNWADSTSWVGGRSPVNGDTVIIDDGARVDGTSGNPIMAMITVGRGLRPDSARLNFRGMTVNGKITVLRRRDCLAGSYTTTGDVEFNSDANFSTINDETRALSLTFIGVGIKRLYRSVPGQMDTTFTSLRVKNRACTLQVDHKWVTRCNLHLDSDFFNPLGGYVIGRTIRPPFVLIENVPTPSIIIRKGQYIGVSPSGLMHKLNYYYYGDGYVNREVRTVGNEMSVGPRINHIESRELYRLNCKSVGMVYADPTAVRSHIYMPTDTINSIGFHDFTSDYDYDTLRNLSFSPKFRRHVPFSTIVPRFLLGSERSNRLVRIEGPARYLIEYIDQVPPTTGILLQGDLTGLIGKSYVRISRYAGSGDSLTVSFYKMLTDSITTPRYYYCLAQGRTPNGPWKAVSVRDGSRYFRNIREAKVSLLDGEYFSFGTRETPFDAQIAYLKLPTGSQCNCLTSRFLPVTVGVTNLGTQPLTSLEVGVRTNVDFKQVTLNFATPLLQFQTDTLYLTGTDGLDLSAQSLGMATVWISHPQFTNRADDTVQRALPRIQQLNFDSRQDTVTLDWLQTATKFRLGLLRDWTFSSSPRVPTTFNFNSTYFQLIVRGFNYQLTTPNLAIPAGKSYIEVGAFQSSTATNDSLFLEYTSDCGDTWTLISKHPKSSYMVKSGSLRVPPAKVDSLVFTAPTTISVRVRPTTRFASSTWVFHYLRVRQFPTCLPATTNQKASTLIYPNPAHNQLTYAGSQDGKLSLINQLGQVVFIAHVTEGTTLQLPTQVVPGLYQVMVQQVGGYILRSKLIVE